MSGDLDRLKQLLNGVGADDGMISRGVSLTERGYDKLASSFGVSAEEIKNMISQLKNLLSSDEQNIHIAEAPNRYSYETDYLNNVTLRDRKTGEIRNLVGHEAFSVLAEIERLGDYQSLVAAYFQNKRLNEFAGSVVADQDELHEVDAELGHQSGTMNFQYRQYPATIKFWVEHSKFNVKLISIREPGGETEAHVGPDVIKAAEDFAMKMIESGDV
jgi:hypothetical protein